MAFAQDQTHSRLTGRSRLQLLILILLSLLIFGYNLGANSLHNDDEAKHAVVAREAATQGHWLPLTYNGRTYYSKPPLRIWLTALTFKVAGINEWTVRIWSGIFALLTVLALYLLGRRIWNDRLAFLSALILLTSHQYVYNHCARTGETDSLLILCWTCGLLLLQLAIQQTNRKMLFISAAFIGLCGIVKHLGFIPIVLAVAIGYVVLAGAWRSFPMKTWFVSLGVVLAAALPWHLAMWFLKGQEFINAYFLGEVVEKRMRVKPPSRTWTSPGQYISILTMVRGFFPWSFLLPFALGDLIGSRRFRRDWLLPTLWLVVALFVTVLSGRKFTWYVLPAFPAAAILVARLLDRFLASSSTRFAQVGVLLGGIAAMATLTTAATHNPFEFIARRQMLNYAFLGNIRTPETSLAIAVAELLAIAGVVALVYYFLGRTRKPEFLQESMRTGLMMMILGLALYTVIVPLQHSRHKTTLHLMAIASQEHLIDGEVLHIALPQKKTKSTRFSYYFGASDFRRADEEMIDSGALEGKLVLSDWPTLEQAGIELPEEHLAHSGGMVLLRWPEA